MWNPILDRVIISRDVIFDESQNKYDHIVTNNVNENLME